MFFKKTLSIIVYFKRLFFLDAIASSNALPLFYKKLAYCDKMFLNKIKLIKVFIFDNKILFNAVSLHFAY